ncbi:hypothetical protein QTP88_029369 [Uroleucon formosanum]
MKSKQSEFNTNEEEATSSGLQSVGGNDIVSENQKSRCFGPDSKIVESDSRSERKSEFCKDDKLDSSESLSNTDV